jgi:hypothetical protein
MLVLMVGWGGGAASEAPPIESHEQAEDSVRPAGNTKPQEYPAEPAKSYVFPKPHAEAKQTIANDNADQREDEASEFWVFFRHRLKITDSILVVFTGLLFVATLLLWWHTRKLVIGADKTAERQLRAYVFTNPVNSDPGLSLPKLYPVIYSVYNTGRTPATVIEIARAVDVLPYPLPKNYVLTPPKNVGGAGVVLGPGARFDAGRIQADRTFTKAEIDAIKSNLASHRIYLHGWLIYKDVFGRTRHTDFCQSLVWDSANKGPDGQNRSTWDITEGRNSFD